MFGYQPTSEQPPKRFDDRLPEFFDIVHKWLTQLPVGTRLDDTELYKELQNMLYAEFDRQYQDLTKL
jgi:hypothetical protein